MDSISNFYIENTVLIKYNGTESRVVIPDYIKKIGENAFAENHFVTSIIMGSGVYEIGKGAFSYCRNLKEITLLNGLKIIGENAFAWCKNLKKIIIPQTVTKIGEGAFDELMAQSENDRLIILCEVCKPLFRLPKGWSKRWLGENGKKSARVIWDCKI